MFESLKTWLNSKGSYKDGVAIYRHYGDDNDFLRFLEVSNHSSIAYNRLFTALRAVYYKLKGVQVPASPLLESTSAVISSSVNDSDGKSESIHTSTTIQAPTVVSNPALEASASDAANRIYKQLMNERARLFYNNCKIEAERYENNDDQVAIRKQYVMSILDLQPRMHNAYATLRYVKQHGVMPETSPTSSTVEESFVIPTNPIQLEKFRVNLLKRIARQKKLEQTPDRVAYLQSLEQLKTDVYDAIGNLK